MCIRDSTYTDGSAICLRIGSKGPLEEDTWYYMTVEGDTRLFALSRGIEEELDVSRAQLYPVTQPTIHQARLDAITFTGEDEEILAQWLLEGEITDSDAAASWRDVYKRQGHAPAHPGQLAGGLRRPTQGL